MRVTIVHNKSKQEAINIVDRSFDDLFQALPATPLKITNQDRSWTGAVMTFSLIAKLGFLQNPIRGTVEVTDREITIEADLGLLEKLISRGTFQTAVQGKLQKLLES